MWVKMRMILALMQELRFFDILFDECNLFCSGLSLNFFLFDMRENVKCFLEARLSVAEA